MIPDSDLEALKSFDSRGRIALSAYLRLDTPQRRDSAYDEFIKQMQELVEPGCPHNPADLWQMRTDHEHKRVKQERSDQEGWPRGPRRRLSGWSQLPAACWLGGW